MLVGSKHRNLFSSSAAFLDDVRLFDCALTGSIPNSIGNSTALLQVWLYGNQLTGCIPQSIGSLTLLDQLLLYENQLSGTLPSEMGNLTLLRVSTVNDNLLSGSLSNELSLLAKLIRLDISYNQFNDGAEQVCPLNDPSVSNGNLKSFVADCFSTPIPVTPRDIDYSCCTRCCAEEAGCVDP